MYYEFLFVTSSLDRLSVVLICADMVFETLWSLMVWRFTIFDIDIPTWWDTKTRFSISMLWYFPHWFLDIGFLSHLGTFCLVKLWEFFDIVLAIDIVLTFEICHEITIWNMPIFDKVNYIEIEPALGRRELNRP